MEEVEEKKEETGEARGGRRVRNKMEEWWRNGRKRGDGSTI